MPCDANAIFPFLKYVSSFLNINSYLSFRSLKYISHILTIHRILISYHISIIKPLLFILANSIAFPSTNRLIRVYPPFVADNSNI